MKNAAHARQLWRVITDLNLDARHAELADYRLMIEQGLLDDDLAQDILLQLDPLIRHARDHPNPLRRPPSSEELYGDGSPDIELGALVDDPEIRFGLRIRDRPRNVLISGNAGSGKTTTMYNILEGAHAFNVAHPGDLSASSSRTPSSTTADSPRFFADPWFISACMIPELGCHWPRPKVCPRTSGSIFCQQSGVRGVASCPVGPPLRI